MYFKMEFIRSILAQAQSAADREPRAPETRDPACNGVPEDAGHVCARPPVRVTATRTASSFVPEAGPCVCPTAVAGVVFPVPSPAAAFITFHW